MNSNSALLYLAKTKLINTFKKMIKKPLKLIGTILVVAYFVMIPFTMLPLIKDFGLANPEGFVLLVTLGNIYITLPSLLTYLKRKGIAFDKSDVNLVFTTPIKSKNVLIFSIYKQAYISVVFTLMMSVAGVFAFNISPLQMLVFFFVDLFIYNTLLNMTGVLMYGSYRITEKTKKIIRYVAFAMMLGVLGIVIFNVLETKAFNLLGVSNALSNPILYLLPVIGQGIAALNLIVLGPTVYNVLGFIALILATFLIVKLVQEIPNDGEYYEDALGFAEDISRKLEQAGPNGNILMLKKRNKKAISSTSQQFKYDGAKVIFERQLLEFKRSTRFVLGFRDMVTVIVSIGVGVYLLYTKTDVPQDLYLLSGIGFIAYTSMFFSRKPLWVDEFNNLMYYMIPEKSHIKLLYANALDYLMTIIRSVLIVVPISVGAKQSPLYIIMMVTISAMVEIMISSSKMISEQYLSVKVNQLVATFATFIVNAIILLPIVGLIMLIMITDMAVLISIGIILYCFLVTFGFLVAASKIFSGAEALKQ